MQQAKGYSECERFDAKYIFSTNGHRYAKFNKFASLDHLVGGHEQARRHGQAERLRRFQVEGCLELGRCLHRKVGGIGAAQDAVDIIRRVPVLATRSAP